MMSISRVSMRSLVSRLSYTLSAPLIPVIILQNFGMFDLVMKKCLYNKNGYSP